VIVLPAPPLAPDEAARRVATGADPVWLSSPGAISDTSIALDLVACDPVELVRSAALADLEDAWSRARRRWGVGDVASAAGTTDPRAAPPIAVGWLSYDLAREWLPIGRGLPPRPIGHVAWPADLEFRFFDAIWMRERDGAEAFVLGTNPASADHLLARLTRRGGPPGGAIGDARRDRLGGPPRLGPWSGAEARAAYLAAVARIQEYLRAGDVYQVNLTRRLTAELGPGDPVWMAAELRARAPAPHAIWLGGRSVEGGPIDRLVVGNSPERFLRVEPDGRVETRPIKGTRPRGLRARAGRRGVGQEDAIEDAIEAAIGAAIDPELDAAARQALLASPKDRAEHVMIVDLERNDLGRVAKVGSVVCRDLARAVAFPRVHHLVSTVSAELRPGVGLEELLRATFPGGSITGAPKRRAMEIIDALEPVPRGIYTGATGWLGAAGNLDLAVAIRTAVVDRGQVALGVGGGIVIDSVPEEEWIETELKARAFLELGRREEDRAILP
jgi:para-aminobenzoate synthetase component 1